MPSNMTRPLNNWSVGNGNRRSTNGSTLVCDHCGFNGHTIDKCFKLIGYPADSGKRNNNNSNNQGVQNFNKRFINNNNFVGSSSTSFSDDQISKLISLIKENSLNSTGKGVQANMSDPILNKSKKFNKNFHKFFGLKSQPHSAPVVAGLIIDSGANQHLTYTDKDLVNVIDISYLGITVSHPNRTEACITKVRNMLLNKILIIYDVLVVPEYCVSLMSFHKVARDNNLIVAFDESKCFVLPQDLRDMKVLGIASIVPSNTSQELNHLKFFDKLSDEIPNTPYDEERVIDNPNGEGSNSSQVGSPTIDQSNTEGVHSLGPMDLQLACKDQNWVEAMNKEMDALYRNDTWEIIGLPKDRKSIGDKWVFKIKYKSNDIFYSVHCLSQFIHRTLRSHLKIALKVLRYLKGNLGKGIHIVKQPKASFEAFVDADWAKCIITRKFVTSFCIKLNGSLISWKIKKQNTLSKSPAEAEYRAMASVTSEITWILKILKDLEWDHFIPVKLFCDSQAAIKIAANPIFHERTKNLEIDLYFIREIFLSRVIETQKISSAIQPADIFTKGLDKAQHENLVSKLRLIDVLQLCKKLIDQGVGSTSGIRACALRNFDLGKMELENSQNNALAKLPMLKLGEYEMWEIRIKQYFQIQDYALWEVIENGNSQHLRFTQEGIHSKTEQLAKDCQGKAVNEVPNSSIGQCKAIFAKDEAPRDETSSNGTNELHLVSFIFDDDVQVYEENE
ncbi:hypothetical protein Tco_0098612 [Tanacetum coccineum]